MFVSMLEIEFKLSTVDHSSWTLEKPFLLQELGRYIAELKDFAYRTGGNEHYGDKPWPNH